ncbi:hypothetical protein [Streptomyces sp. XY332]|uniref:hypothetical protein n=1 Tax=Streptomyces sp. XY332 TaxID=1415561 RepID=UPI0006B1E9A8|nr:hypothetical protein [Streptomyces sp. XY332]
MSTDTSGPSRGITDSAGSAPGWVQSAFEVWTEYGLLLFGLLFTAVWWRARARAGPRALALTGPISTIAAAMRASGGRAAVRFTGPGPARQPRNVPGCRLP